MIPVSSEYNFDQKEVPVRDEEEASGEDSNDIQVSMNWQVNGKDEEEQEPQQPNKSLMAVCRFVISYWPQRSVLYFVRRIDRKLCVH